MRGFPNFRQRIKPMVFEHPPEFKLLWNDSGNSVALFVSEEPWAFIDEKTHTGYSKGILKASDMRLWRKLKEKPVRPLPWDQELYEKLFRDYL